MGSLDHAAESLPWWRCEAEGPPVHTPIGLAVYAPYWEAVFLASFTGVGDDFHGVPPIVCKRYAQMPVPPVLVLEERRELLFVDPVENWLAVLVNRLYPFHAVNFGVGEFVFGQRG